MNKLYDLLRTALPWNAYRIMRRGAQVVAAFRLAHGREPTEQEWDRLSEQVGNEVLGKRDHEEVQPHLWAEMWKDIRQGNDVSPSKLEAYRQRLDESFPDEEVTP